MGAITRSIGLRRRPEERAELAAAQLRVILVREDDTNARGAHVPHLVCRSTAGCSKVTARGCSRTTA